VKPYVVALIVVVAVLGGFYGGYKVGQSNVGASTTSQGQVARNPAGAGGGGFAGTRGGGGLAAACPTPGATPSTGQAIARGTISNLGSSSLTVTNPSCDVKVTLGTNVTITKQTAGSTADLKNTLTVTITGTRQADGSILAQTIQIAGGQAGS
jgi:hypothetical protein